MPDMTVSALQSKINAVLDAANLKIHDELLYPAIKAEFAKVCKRNPKLQGIIVAMGAVSFTFSDDSS
jgi:hypothetical protein